MLTSAGLNFGVRRGIPHLSGICLGVGIMFLLVGLGFGTLFELYPVLHETIKVIGVIYLLYLAWKIGSTRQSSTDNTQSKPMTFWQAVAFQWVNPKAWVMGSSALAAFTSLEGNFFIQVLIVSASFKVITIPSAGIWLVFGASLQHILKDPNHFKIFNISMALLLVASILPVIWDTIS